MRKPITQTDLVDNPRATLRAWQKYEPIVVAAFRKFPQPFHWSPSPHNLSCQTVVSRIRDAIRGKLAFDYPSPVSTEDLTEWFKQVIFKVIDNTVYIGRKDRIAEVLPATEERKDGMVFDSLNLGEITAFALLLSAGKLSGPVIIRNPNPHLVYPDFPNFHVIPRPDGSLVLL